MRFDMLPEGEGWLAIEVVAAHPGCDYNAAVVDGALFCNKCGFAGPVGPPAEVLALLEPCETCFGRGWDLIRPIGDDATTLCPDCVKGRRKFDVETPCDCEWDQSDDALVAQYGCCDTGTISRTFTVGEHGLCRIRPAKEWAHPAEPAVQMGVIWRAENECLDGLLRKVTVHGLTERTTRALHVKEVT